MKLWLPLIGMIRGGDSKVNFTRDFVVELRGGNETAWRISQDHQLDLIGEVFEGHFHFKAPSLSSRHRRSSETGAIDQLRKELTKRHDVVWAEQQRVLKRVKRGVGTQDPLFPFMWYLNPGYEKTDHMNVTGAWKQGYTGAGVVVSILDDGLEKNHPDLAHNYDSAASFDINDNDSDPSPRYSRHNRRFTLHHAIRRPNSNHMAPLTEDMVGFIPEDNMHGTRCAGQVAATADNGVCVPGIAFNARIGGIRMLDGEITDLVEAKSVGFNPAHIDIYSASWGPEDDGRTVEGPGELTRKALEFGARSGRQNKGSIFIWASGNGGKHGDNCNCDGYAASIYTITVSSTTITQEVPWYSEKCASTFATTYSSGSSGQPKIYTTDLRGLCTGKHEGTSASAPFAAGIVALTLEANPELTWRDVQHVIVNSATKANLQSADWRQNGAGRWYSHRFGYGFLNAGKMVETARKWKNVGRQQIFTKSVIGRSQHHDHLPILSTNGPDNPVEVFFMVTKKENKNVARLEHVVINLNIQIQRRGDLKIVLRSPMGTESNLLDVRPGDSSSRGYTNHQFLTVHMWDEIPYGVWQLRIVNHRRNIVSIGQLKKFELTLYGTNDVHEDTIVFAEPPPPTPKDADKWPGVKTAQKLPQPRFSYINQFGRRYKQVKKSKSPKASPSWKLREALKSDQTITVEGLARLLNIDWSKYKSG